MRKLGYTAAAVVVLMAVTAACGGGDRSGGRALTLEMIDNPFIPNELTALVGETVTFEFTNNGAVGPRRFHRRRRGPS